MPRSLRLEFPGAFYHVMARGNRRETIFHDDDDRRFFLATLSEACGMTGWRVHAWVLMGNHYHLFIETPEANLVAGMSWLQNPVTGRAPQVIAHGEDQAERWLKEGLLASGLVPDDLAGLKGSDPRKLALADLLWRRTTVSQEWIAAKLSMGGAANVSQQLRRRKNEKGKVKLPPKLKHFLADAWGRES